MTKVRIDKWLWSVRIYKSRTLATDACKAGKVKVGEDAVKPSYLVKEGEVIEVRKDGFNFQYRTIILLEKRVGAPIAVTCYEDITPEEERLKYTSWFLNNKSTSERRQRGAGRPTKKERREIDQFKLADDEP
ncbi:MAG: RNA-binding S4 domain-containing protein [Saprospiraceae bacterium]